MHLRKKFAFVALVMLTCLGGRAGAAEPEPTPTWVEHDWGWSSHTLWNGCNEYSDFAVFSDSRRTSDYTFEYTLSLHSPGGDLVDAIQASGSGPSFSHQGLSLEVCDEHGPGLYALSWEARWFDPSGATVFENTRHGDVRFYRIATRTRLAVSDTTPKRGDVVTYKLRALRDAPSGVYEPYSNARMALFRNCSGSWSKVHDAKLSADGDGRVVLKRNYNTRQSCKFRAKTFQTDRSKASISVVRQLYPH